MRLKCIAVIMDNGIMNALEGASDICIKCTRNGFEGKISDRLHVSWLTKYLLPQEPNVAWLTSIAVGV